MGRGHVASSKWSFANISQENRDLNSRIFFVVVTEFCQYLVSLEEDLKSEMKLSPQPTF